MPPPALALRPQRLKRREQFLAVAAAGRSVPMPGFVLQAKRGEAEGVRLGFTVSRKVGNAVERNRVRRRLREAARHVLAECGPAAADLVLIGRRAALSRPFDTLCADLRRALSAIEKEERPSKREGGPSPP